MPSTYSAASLSRLFRLFHFTKVLSLLGRKNRRGRWSKGIYELQPIYLYIRAFVIGLDGLEEGETTRVAALARSSELSRKSHPAIQPASQYYTVPPAVT